MNDDVSLYFLIGFDSQILSAWILGGESGQPKVDTCGQALHKNEVFC